MKAHIARNQNAGVPLALGWNLSAADRGILEGMAPAFGMKLLLVSPADAGRTVAQLLGEVETKAARTLVLEPGAYPPALVLANFKEKDVDTLLDLMKQAKVNIPLKAIVTPSNKNWVFGDLLAHLQEEHAETETMEALCRRSDGCGALCRASGRLHGKEPGRLFGWHSSAGGASALLHHLL